MNVEEVEEGTMDISVEKYEDILTEIDTNYKNVEVMKEKLKQQNTELLALSLLLNKDFPINQVFRVTVKVYDNKFDLHYQNSYLNPNSFQEEEDKVLYLVSIFISKAFKEKVSNRYLNFNVKLQNDSSCTYQTVNYRAESSLATHGPDLFLVLPFDSYNPNTLLEVHLFYCLEEFWPKVKIASIPIDFSYYFTDKRTNQLQVNSSDSSYTSSKRFELPCNLDKTAFLKTFFKNCYHRLNIPDICTTSNNIINTRIIHENNEVSYIKYYFDKQKIEIETNISRIPLFKYLLYDENKEVDLTEKIKELKELRRVLKDEESEYNNKAILLEKLKKLRQFIEKF